MKKIALIVLTLFLVSMLVYGCGGGSFVGQDSNKGKVSLQVSYPQDIRPKLKLAPEYISYYLIDVYDPTLDSSSTTPSSPTGTTSTATPVLPTTMDPVVPTTRLDYPQNSAVINEVPIGLKIVVVKGYDVNGELAYYGSMQINVIAGNNTPVDMPITPVTPTQTPTYSPTQTPTYSPTSSPTFSPTSSPTFSPTTSPTISPTPAVGWYWENPKPSGHTYLSTWGTADNNIYAVGHDGALIHYNGTTWQSVVSPTTYALTGIEGINANNIMAVGSGGTVLWYDGTAWGIITPSFVGSTDLNDLCTLPSGAFVVAGFGDVIVSYSGGTWTNRPIGNASVDIYAIDGNSINNLYAMGYEKPTIPGTAGKYVIYHYNGTAWSLLRSSSDDSPNVIQYNDIWVSGSGMLYVTGFNYSAPDSGMILKYDPVTSTWTGPDNISGCSFYTIDGTSDSDIYTAGDNDCIYHFDGTQWLAEAIPTSLGEALNGIYDGPNSVVAVGEKGIIYRLDSKAGGVWNIERNGYISVDTTIKAIWGIAGGQYFAAGSAAAAKPNNIYTKVGTNWEISLGLLADQYINSIFGVSATQVYAVGGGPATTTGLALVYNGFTWITVPGAPTGMGEYTDAWASGPSDVYFTSSQGYIMHHNGSAWSTTTLPGFSPKAIWGFAANDIYAVGDSGMMYHYNGTSWITITGFSGSVNFKDIWGSSATDIYAVGVYSSTFSGGIVYHYNGTSWSQVLLMTGEPFNSVYGSDPNLVFVCGNGGKVYRTATAGGSSWVSVSTSASADMFSVFTTSANDIFIGGGYGTIMHYPTP